MVELNNVWLAFLMGLGGITHCLGMCGGFSAALALHSKNTFGANSLLYCHLGRIVTYMALAASLATVNAWLPVGLQQAVLLLSMVLIAVIALSLSGLLPRKIPMAIPVWRHIYPLWRWLQNRPLSRFNRFCTGLVWGLLPCGLSYSVALWAASSQNPLMAAGLMAVFGITTVPSLWLGGQLIQQLSRHLAQAWIRQLIALGIIISGGLFTMHQFMHTHHSAEVHRAETEAPQHHRGSEHGHHHH